MKRLSCDLGVLAPFVAAVCILAGSAFLHVQEMQRLESLLTEHDRLLDVSTELQASRRALLEGSDPVQGRAAAAPHLRALSDLGGRDMDVAGHVAALQHASLTPASAITHLDALQRENAAAGMRNAEALVQSQTTLRQRLYLLVGLGGVALAYACLVLLRAVRAHARLDERLRYETSHDSLTGLPNRRFFTQWSERVLAQARRERSQMALLYIDLDGFRRVNDEQGREIGDRLLRVAAQRFRQRVRESDVLARIGSDEYVILTPVDRDEAASVTPLAERLIATLLAPLLPQFGERYPVGASIGIAVYPPDGVTVDVLLHAAEVAMREAKAAGGNQFRFVTGEVPAVSGS